MRVCARACVCVCVDSHDIIFAVRRGYAAAEVRPSRTVRDDGRPKSRSDRGEIGRLFDRISGPQVCVLPATNVAIVEGHND